MKSFSVRMFEFVLLRIHIDGGWLVVKDTRFSKRNTTIISVTLM